MWHGAQLKKAQGQLYLFISTGTDSEYVRFS